MKKDANFRNGVSDFRKKTQSAVWVFPSDYRAWREARYGKAVQR